MLKSFWYLVFFTLISNFTYAENINDEIFTDEGGEIVDEDNLSKVENSIIEQNEDTNSNKNYQQAKIIALNKITAKSQEITLKIGEPKYFGNIEITLRKCIKDLNPYSPDNKILLTVMDNKIDDDQIMIFQGWLISSNIAISTLQHPVYEIFAKECL